MERSGKILLYGGAIIGILALLKYKVFAEPAATGGGKSEESSESETEHGSGGGGASMGSIPIEFTPNLSALNSQANTIPPTSSSSTNSSTPTSTEATFNVNTSNTAQTSSTGVRNKPLIEAGSATIQLGFTGKKYYGFRGDKGLNSLFI